MEIETVVALGIALGALFIAWYSTRFSERTLHHQALLDVHKDFRSDEMLSALDGIWKFYRDFENGHPHLKKDSLKFKEALKAEYKIIHEQQRDNIANNVLKAEESLNYKRRLITHFYIHLASLYKHSVLPPEMIFDWWVPSDFKIFDDFIIPLEEATSELCDTFEEETKFALEPLYELEYDCKLYFNENKNRILSKYSSYKEKLNSGENLE